MTESKATPFIICTKCSCMSFNTNDIEKRYCGVCHKFHADQSEYFVADGTENQLNIFREFLAILSRGPKSGALATNAEGADVAKVSDKPNLEQLLLSKFTLIPGTTHKEAAREFISDARQRINPDVPLFFAACAIVAGHDALAAIILGVSPDDA